MARAFLPEDGRYVALLDETERFMIHGLMQQTRIVLSPEVESTGDAFADLVASMGVSVASEDQAEDRAEDQTEGRAEDQQAQDQETGDDAWPSGGGEERDPALDRLLPDAHRGDDAVAAEFRRLTEEGLRQRKSANLDVAMERLAAAADDEVALDEAQAPAFLMALTDVRLLLGERMGMRTEEDAERLHAAMEVIDDDDPLGYAMAWYDFLTWLQETLTQALMDGD